MFNEQKDNKDNVIYKALNSKYVRKWVLQYLLRGWTIDTSGADNRIWTDTN